MSCSKLKNGLMALGTVDALVALGSFFFIGRDNVRPLNFSPAASVFVVAEFGGLALLTASCFNCARPLRQGIVDVKKSSTYFTGLFFVSFYAFHFINTSRTSFNAWSTPCHAMAFVNTLLRLTFPIPLTKCLLIGQPSTLTNCFERVFMFTMLLNELVRNVGAQLKYPILVHSMIGELGTDILFFAITKPCTVVFLFRCLQHVAGIHRPHDDALADDTTQDALPQKKTPCAGALHFPTTPLSGHAKASRSGDMEAPFLSGEAKSPRSEEANMPHGDDVEAKVDGPVLTTALGAPPLPGAPAVPAAPAPVAFAAPLAIVASLGLSGFAVMYASDVENRAPMETECFYESGRSVLCVACVVAVWPLYSRKHLRPVFWLDILLFAGQVVATAGTIAFLLTGPIPAKSPCQNTLALLFTQATSLAFAMMQFWVVFLSKPVASPVRYFLLFVSLGMVWFDFSDEAQHLLHWNEIADEDDTLQKISFLCVQCVFWMALEFKVLAVETMFE